MLSINSLRILTDQRLKALKQSLYSQRYSTFYICECCDERHMLDEDGFNHYTADIATISRIQMERKNG